jgi:SAGA-associated factor 29
MASRNRNRQAPVKDDADEERSLWNQLVTDAKRVDGLIVCLPICCHVLSVAPLTHILEFT